MSPAPPRQPAGIGLWAGIAATVLALGIAITLSVGLLALSYARASAPTALPVSAPAEPGAGTPESDTPALAFATPVPGAATSADPSLTERLRNNPSGALSRGAAFLVMLLLLFFVGQWGLRSTLHPAALGVAVACAWGFAILAALLSLGAALRFTLTSDISLLEYVSYLGLMGLNLIMAVVLAALGRHASACRSFAILMGLVTVAQLLLTLFGSGLRFDLHFLINFGFLIVLMVSVAALLYITGLIEQLYPPISQPPVGRV